MLYATPGPHLFSMKAHAVLDYALGVLLMAAPWLFGFSDAPIAMAVAVCMGSGLIGYSLFTRYPLSWYGILPLNIHLSMDVVSGMLLIASPWFCMFADRIWWPHVTVGVLQIGLALLTGFRGVNADDADDRPDDVSGTAGLVPIAQPIPRNVL